MTENQEREALREFAKARVGNTALMNLAAANYVEQTDGYGGIDKKSVYSYLYDQVEENLDPVANEVIAKSTIDGLKATRNPNSRYSENISAQALTQNAAQILESYLPDITLGDLFEIMGNYTTENVEDYAGQYMADLAQADDPVAQAIAMSAGTAWKSYISQKATAEALARGTQNAPKSLENIVLRAREAQNGNDNGGR